MKIEMGGSTGTLLIVFLVLKLTHQIAWSWWWVTCPLWASIALVSGLLLLAGLIAVVGTLFSGMGDIISARKFNRRLKR